MTIEERVELLNQSIESHDRQLGEITEKVDGIAVKLDSLTVKVDGIATKLDSLVDVVDGVVGQICELSGKVSLLTDIVTQLAINQDKIAGAHEVLVRATTRLAEQVMQHGLRLAKLEG